MPESIEPDHYAVAWIPQSLAELRLRRLHPQNHMTASLYFPIDSLIKD